jgi:hypothetical protein
VSLTRPLPSHRYLRAQLTTATASVSACLLALSVLLLVLGAGLAYASLTLRWPYYSGVSLTASDLNSLTPAQRADMTIWWGDSMHEGWWCGQWPLIVPALALLSVLPLLVAAMRQRAVTRLWSWFGLLGLVCAALGFANVLLIPRRTRLL